MAGIITTGSFPKGLVVGVKSWWDSAANAAPQYAAVLFKTVSSENNFEEYVQEVGLGVAVAKPEGTPIQFDTTQQGFITRGTNVAYGLGIITTHEERMDNRYMKLTQNRVEKLRRAFDETRNINAANIYNRAFNPTYVGGDGVSLLNSAHPNFSGGTWQNKLIVDAPLSQAALEDMLTLMMSVKDDRGHFEPMTAARLVVNPYNYFAAEKILGSEKEVAANNNAINPLHTQKLIAKGFVSCPYLTSTGAWFITTDCQDGMVHQEREKLSLWQDNDSDTRNFKVGAYERYALLWVNPRGLFGSNAA